MSHLTGIFRGTDTIAGVKFANEYYGIDMAGFSIPAKGTQYCNILGKRKRK